MQIARLTWLAVLAGILTLAAVKGSPGTPRADAAAQARQYILRGLAYEQMGRHQDAIADFSQAIDGRLLNRADLVRALFDRGVANDALGQRQAALADYTAAIKRDPSFSPALNNRANLYRRIGRMAEAKRDYFAALKYPGALREYPYYGLGQIAEKLGDTDTARDYYQKALAANPAFALAAEGLMGLQPAKRPALRQTRPVQATPAAAPVPVASVPAAPDVPLRRAIVDLSRRPSGVQVQLGAYRDQQTAAEGWKRIAAANSDLLSRLSPIMVPVDLPGKGRVWRLRAAVPDKASARRLCNSLTSVGFACVVAWN